MDRTEFETFIANFQISRPGNYTVPDYVLMDCFDEMNNGNTAPLTPLYCYERVVYASWEEGRKWVIYSDDPVIDFLKSYLQGNEYYKPDDEEKEFIKKLLSQANIVERKQP